MKIRNMALGVLAAAVFFSAGTVKNAAAEELQVSAENASGEGVGQSDTRTAVLTLQNQRRTAARP